MFQFCFYEEKSFSIFVFKITCMKRKLMYAAGFVFIALSFTTCTSNCKVCSQNDYNSGGTLIRTGSESEQCDAALIRIEATPDVTILGVTTKWVCR